MASEHVVGWLDPSLNTRNTGDEIIADAVQNELRSFLQDSIILRLPTQTFLTRKERSLASHCDHYVVGGTNLLNGNIPTYLQWKMDPHSYTTYKGSTSLLGVGWWQYQSSPNSISRKIWKNLLSAGVNSVRDEYTKNTLGHIGVTSVNTGCPTMWQLPDVIPFSSAAPTGVIMTITDYHRDPIRDARLIKGLRDRYKSVVAWPQGIQDREYLRGLDRDMEFLGGELKDFNEALQSGQYDYVGTRLHAGVRALQLGVKSTIVAVDNRAPEISKSTGLPVVSQALNDEDWAIVDARTPLMLQIPRDAIEMWKKQFAASILS